MTEALKIKVQVSPELHELLHAKLATIDSPRVRSAYLVNLAESALKGEFAGTRLDQTPVGPTVKLNTAAGTPETAPGPKHDSGALVIPGAAPNQAAPASTTISPNDESLEEVGAGLAWIFDA